MVIVAPIWGELVAALVLVSTRPLASRRTYPEAVGYIGRLSVKVVEVSSSEMGPVGWVRSCVPSARKDVRGALYTRVRGGTKGTVAKVVPRLSTIFTRSVLL